MPAKPAVRYALIALGITFVWIIIEHLAGWNTKRHDIGQYTRMLPMILFWVLIFVTVNQSRGERSPYTFNEGLRDGMLMSLIYCAGFTIMIAFYQKFINPEFFETLKAYTLEQLKARNASEAEIRESLSNMDMSFNGSAISFFLLFVFSFGWGVILSAVAAAVYRKK
jgi:hypothetical protein